ncbi:hypothetical protein [Actinacidiphila oryziradicis]|jgi:hypothetical protein|uniref:Uncharacterized protein n=1 Tax=Actinacidiphila oryziradicis TaxID=2571141 RepID=A0A4U0RU93_9ACTN|nr:hypothetical protein [Actinacidiphila oryziradicis]TJZ98350.1 hypothetical protein FCI23_48375 [Actinacidiphila oryziradicis]
MSGRPTAEVYRIDWVPGTDVLHGTCHCGAERSGQDPVEMWEWMLAHPAGHLTPAATPESIAPGTVGAGRPRQEGATP